MSSGLFRESIFNPMVAKDDSWRSYAFFYRGILTSKSVHEDFRKVSAWCVENFGECGPEEPFRWQCVMGSRCFYIVSPVDAAAFKLRWC